MQWRNFIIIFALFMFFSPSFVFANHRKAVLGDATTSALPTIPPTTEGPGLLLPDSPVYFLDQWKQNIRLFLAFSSENRAKVRESIAGERLAELRFMLAKNDKKGATTALESFSDNMQAAATELEQAKFAGKDVKALAQTINEDIKSKKQVLTVLEDSSAGEFAARVRFASAALKETKIKVEDTLPADQLQKEIEDGLREDIENEVTDASHSARGLEHAIDLLTKLASNAAQKSQEKRQEALAHAIEVKNESLKKQLEKQHELERRQQEKIFEQQQKAFESAREATKKATEAMEKAQESSHETASPTTGVTNGVNTAGSSGSSSSGSSNSGSNESRHGGREDN